MMAQWAPVSLGQLHVGYSDFLLKAQRFWKRNPSRQDQIPKMFGQQDVRATDGLVNPQGDSSASCPTP